MEKCLNIGRCVEFDEIVHSSICVRSDCVGHDCLGAHLHCIGIRLDPYCKLCSLHEPTDRNHLGQCTALSNKTECERYWEARTKKMEN